MPVTGPQRLLGLNHLYAGVIAVGIAIAGMLLLATPDSFRTLSLRVAFDTFAPRIWGAAFLASAVWFGIFHRRRAAATPMAFMMTAWSAMIGCAALTVDGASPTGWIWPACLAILLLFGIARGDL